MYYVSVVVWPQFWISCYAYQPNPLNPESVLADGCVPCITNGFYLHEASKHLNKRETACSFCFAQYCCLQIVKATWKHTNVLCNSIGNCMLSDLYVQKSSHFLPPEELSRWQNQLDKTESDLPIFCKVRVCDVDHKPSAAAWRSGISLNLIATCQATSMNSTKQIELRKIQYFVAF